MYCTQCDTPFSYETGAVIRGIIHNPHYFERLQKLKTGAAVPGEQIGCNGWPDWRFLPIHLRKDDRYRYLLQNAIHTEEVTLRRDLANPETPTNNRDLRIRYLMNELDEDRFKQLIQQRDRKRQKELEIRAVLELFVVTTLEFFNDRPTLIDEVKTAAALTTLLAQFETTINAPLKAIGERYKSRVPQFNPEPNRFRISWPHQSY